MSDNSSRRDQQAGLGPTSPLCHLPRVCLGGHTVGGPNTIPLYTHEARYGIAQLVDTRCYSVWGFYISRMRQYIQVLV
jgi:hypothetical protein